MQGNKIGTSVRDSGFGYSPIPSAMFVSFQQFGGTKVGVYEGVGTAVDQSERGTSRTYTNTTVDGPVRATLDQSWDGGIFQGGDFQFFGSATESIGQVTAYGYLGINEGGMMPRTDDGNPYMVASRLPDFSSTKFTFNTTNTLTASIGASSFKSVGWSLESGFPFFFEYYRGGGYDGIVNGPVEGAYVTSVNAQFSLKTPEGGQVGDQYWNTYSLFLPFRTALPSATNFIELGNAGEM